MRTVDAMGAARYGMQSNRANLTRSGRSMDTGAAVQATRTLSPEGDPTIDSDPTSPLSSAIEPVAI